MARRICLFRVTFVIGPDGVIEHVWEKVHPEGHAAEVLAFLDEAEVTCSPCLKAGASQATYVPTDCVSA